MSTYIKEDMDAYLDGLYLFKNSFIAIMKWIHPLIPVYHHAPTLLLIGCVVLQICCLVHNKIKILVSYGQH